MIRAPSAVPQAPSPASGRKNWLWFVPAAVYLATMVVPRALPHAAGCDFRHFYIGGLTFLDGANPYDGLQAESAWQRLGTGLPRFVAPYIPPEYGTAYPPQMPLMSAPLAVLPYHAARLIWLGINLACIAGLVAYGLWRWAGAWPPVAQAALATAIVGLDPVGQCLFVGQLTLVVTTLAFAAAVAEERGHSRTAGILFAFAMVKFTCVLLIPVWLLLRRSWHTLLWFVLALVVLNAGAILTIGIEEFATAFRDAVDLARAMPLNDPGSILGSYNVVSIDTLLCRFGFPFQFDAQPLIPFFAGAGMLASLVRLHRSRPDAMSAVAWLLLVCLFFLNHRPYDVVALIPTLFLLPTWLPKRDPRLLLAYACIGCFLFESPYEVMTDPSALTNADVFLRLSYRNWALLALWGLVLSSPLGLCQARSAVPVTDTHSDLSQVPTDPTPRPPEATNTTK